ncbi:MAG: ABC transporter permease subunit [Clostridia bacterium]
MDPNCFPAIYTITNVWKTFGWDSILYMSAMSSIDMNLYEAAKLDGANRVQQMWNITLPSIKPTIMLLLILPLAAS